MISNDRFHCALCGRFMFAWRTFPTHRACEIEESNREDWLRARAWAERHGEEFCMFDPTHLTGSWMHNNRCATPAAPTNEVQG